MEKDYLLNKKYGRFTIAAFAVIFAALSLCALCKGEVYLPCATVADSVVRLHIIANSDTVFDQSVKLKVRDAVIEKYAAELAGLKSRAAALDYLEDHAEAIGKFAGEVLASCGCGYEAKAFCGETEFPDKNYGFLTFGEGEYLSLNITLGSGSGQNWWCVLYPPLCFLNVRAEEGYDEKKDADKKIKVKSAIWEWVKGEKK